EERGDSELEQPGVARLEVEREGEDREDEDVDQLAIETELDAERGQGEVIEDRQERIDHQGDEPQGPGRWPGRVHRAQTFSRSDEPRRPAGRKTRMPIRIPNSTAACHWAPMYWSEKARTRPMTRPPSTAPGIEPMPPRTAAVKA